MPGRLGAPSLPGDKRPLISDEASAATGGTEPGKVLGSKTIPNNWTNGQPRNIQTNRQTMRPLLQQEGQS